MVLVVLAGVIGSSFFLNGQWQIAQRREMYIPDLEAATTQNRYDGSLLATLAARYAQAARYQRASELLREAVQVGESDSSIWLTWAACEAAEGRRSEAQAVLQLAQVRAPEAQQEARMALRRLQALPANATNAEATRAICPLGPDMILGRFAHSTVFSPISETFGQFDRQNSGFETRRAWRNREPKKPLILALWADALLRNNRLREAEAQALKAVEISQKSSPEALLVLGDVFFRGGLHAKAGLQYKAALALKPDWPPALIGLGNVGVEKQLIGLAVDCFERATKLVPNNPDAWIGLGRAYSNQKLRHDKARTAFATAAKLAPDRTDFLPYYSDAMRMTFQFREAEALLRRRLQAAPNDARSQFLLAALLLDDERTAQRETEAEKLLRRSLALEDRALIVRLRLAQLLLDQNRAAEAVPILEKGNQHSPKSAQVVTLLARAYERSGQKKIAGVARRVAMELSEYSRLVESAEQKERAQPADIANHRELAAIYRSGGEEEKARRQEEIIFYLKNRPDAASRGLRSLQRGTSSVHPIVEEKPVRPVGSDKR